MKPLLSRPARILRLNLIGLLCVALLGALFSARAATTITLDYTNPTGNTITVVNADSLTLLRGTGTGTMTNNGTIALNSTGSNTDLIVSGGVVTLAGTGSVTMSDRAANRIYGAATTDSLVNASGHTIQGAGQIGLGITGLTNQGLIVANQTNNLTITPNSSGMINTGVLRAANNATLILQGTFNNTSGTIEAQSGSTVRFSSATISSGTLSSTGTGHLLTSGSNSFSDVTLAVGSIFDVNNATDAAFGGTFTNLADLRLNSTGSNTDFIVSSNGLTLTGGGTLTLGNNSANRIYGASGTPTLVNQNNTIRGVGQIGVNLLQLDNRSLIDANVSGGTLTIDPAGTGVTNTGTLRASGGGILRVIGGNYANTGGTIEAQDGSNVKFESASVSGGNLTSSGTGRLINANDSTYTGVTLTTSSILDINNATAATMGGTFTNQGTVNLNSTGSNTDLVVAAGGLTLSGGGVISLGDNFANRIYGSGGTPTLLNQNNTIRGAGQIGVNLLAIDNRATIQANISGSTLQIDSAGNGVTNTGTLQALNGGILRLDSSTVANAGGIIHAATGSRADLAASSVSDGTLTTTGTGVIRIASASTFGGVLTISTGSLVDIPNASNLTLLASGLYHNNGNLTLSSTGSNTDLNVSGGDVTVDGTGTITLGNNSPNRIFGSASSDRLVNSTGHTIQGAGQIGVNLMGLVNQGTVIANQPTSLVIDPSTAGVTNTGTLRAASGATLRLQGGTFTNTNGIIEATGSGSVVEFSGASVVNGQLLSSLGGALRNIADSNFTDVTLGTGGDFQISNSIAATFVNTLTNLGALSLNSTGSNTDFIVGGTGDLTLTGGGTLTLGNNAANRIYGAAPSNRLINVNNTIQGSGKIGVDLMGLVNQATIRANQSAPLIIDPSATGVVNTGLLRADAGSTLQLQGGNFTNTNGTIEAFGASALVTFSSATVSGGTLHTANGGLLRNAGASTYTNVLLNGTLEIANSTDATFSGTLDNSGVVQLNSTGSNTDLIVGAGNLTMNGGAIAMSNNGANRIYGASNTNVFVNQGGTISGAGQIGVNLMKLDNRGTINANLSGGVLIIDPSASGVVNTGTLTASNGGILRLSGGSFDNTGGSIAPGSGSRVELDSVAIQGGTLGGTTIRNIASSSLSSLTTLSGLTVEVANASNFTLFGIITNGGLIQLQSTGSNTDLIIDISGVTLNGNGVIELSNNGANRIYGATAGTTLNNINNTIRGSGQLGGNQLTLMNAGTIEANQSTPLTVDISNDAPFTNQGTLRAASGSQLIFADSIVNAAVVSVLSGGTFTGQGTFTQTGGSTSLNGGTFTATSSSFQSGGVLQGSGTINGAVTNGGVIAPGSGGTGTGNGLLTFNQALTLTSTSLLQMELGGVGNYDQIQAPSAVLNGSLAVSFINGFQSTIQSSDTFTLLSITGRTGLSGTFSGIADGTRITTADGLGSFQVNYLVSGVTLSQFVPVPEPSTYVLLALGGAGIYVVRRRFRRS